MTSPPAVRAPCLHVLGAGSILPRAGYGCAGYAVRAAEDGEVTLLDCGPGSVRALAAHGIRLAEVRRVVLSHYHLDHCLDLFALAFARRNPAFEPAPIALHGPVGLAALVGGAPQVLGRWAADPEASVHEVTLDAEGRGGFETPSMTFACTDNGHSPEAVSWRIDHADGWSLAYTGDTNDDPRVADLARGVDLLVAECSFPDEAAQANHLTPSSAGALASAAGARRLLLTHFYPSLDPRPPAPGPRRCTTGRSSWPGTDRCIASAHSAQSSACVPSRPSCCSSSAVPRRIPIASNEPWRRSRRTTWRRT